MTRPQCSAAEKTEMVQEAVEEALTGVLDVHAAFGIAYLNVMPVLNQEVEWAIEDAFDEEQAE